MGGVSVRSAMALAAVAVLGASPAAAQEAAAADPLTVAPDAAIRLMRPDHVSIGVRDLDVMAAWYRNALGFAVEKVWTVEGLDGARLAYVIGPGWRIEMIEGGTGPFAAPPADFDDHFQRGGYGHIGFAVEDVDETVAALAARGVTTFVPAESYPVGAERRVAFFLDPEGNVIEISHPLPGTR